MSREGLSTGSPPERTEIVDSPGAPTVDDPDADARSEAPETVPHARSSRPTGGLPVIAPPIVEGLLGRGGMGVVYSAHDRALTRNVAVKRCTLGRAAETRSVREFVAEARVTGGLQHPNIVPVYSLALADDDVPYFTMQAVLGRNLKEWFADPQNPVGSQQRLEGALEIVLRVCDALAFAHSSGLLHRDVKPENIMVGPHGRVYLMDWGLAVKKEVDATVRVDRAGTPRYMAPEVARGEAIDEGVDIFGLGAILHEIVSGLPPYGTGGATTPNVTIQPLSETLGPGAAPPELCAIVDRAVAMDRRDRYPSVEALQEALRQFLRGGRHLPRQTFAAGEVIVRQGELGERAFLILEGVCQVTQETPQGVIRLRQMGAGEIFGELAVLLDAPRTATVTAEADTSVLVIDRAALRQVGVLDGWSSILLEALAQRFRDLEHEVRQNR